MPLPSVSVTCWSVTVTAAIVVEYGVWFVTKTGPSAAYETSELNVGVTVTEYDACWVCPVGSASSAVGPSLLDVPAPMAHDLLNRVRIEIDRVVEAEGDAGESVRLPRLAVIGRLQARPASRAAIGHHPRGRLATTVGNHR